MGRLTRPRVHASTHTRVRASTRRIHAGLHTSSSKQNKAKSANKKNFFLRGDFRPLPNKNVQFWDHFFLILFPKDSEYHNSLDIWLREVGAKRRLNVTLKSEQTYRHMNILTHRKNPFPWLLSQPDPSLICTLPSLLGKIRPIRLP